MNSLNKPIYEYKVGGSLEKNNPTYVERKADRELYKNLTVGEFCYVFNCRQMGKSSLRVQVRRKLESENICCAAIDLTTLGTGEITIQQWYWGLIYELHDIFNLSDQVDIDTWLDQREQLPPVQQLHHYFKDVVLVHVPGEKIVIFIDEIDNVLDLDFDVSDFFALLRACYNQRAENAAYERLTFVLLGVATPSDLVQDLQQAPFNIGRAIALEGLEFEKSGILAEGLVEKAENPQQVLREILQWTGGQPFLTQKLCQIVQNQSTEVIRAGEEADKIQQLVRAYILDNWEFQDDPQHLRTIRDRLFKDEQKAGRLLGLYQQILEQGSVISEGSSEEMDLKLSGLAVKKGDRLVVYNPIYQEIFNRHWLEEELNKLRDPFYSEAITAWLTSGKQDESRLLRGQALQTAQEWAKGKSLGDEDYQFLRASEQLETVAEREAKVILAEANRKAKQRIRVGSGVLIVSLIAASIAGVMAWTSGETLKVTESQLGQKTEELTKAETRRKQLDTQIQQVKQQEAEAKGNQFKAEEARKQAELDLARAEKKRQTAIKQIEIAQAEVKELKQKRLTIERQLRMAEVKLRQAKQERLIALAGTKLEQDGTRILQRFTAGTQGQIESLLEAIKTGNDLYNLVKDGHSVVNFPAISPLYVLHQILQETTEKNVFQHQGWVTSVAFSPDRKYLATGSEDGTASLWDLKGNLIAKFKGHKDRIFSIVFSPDGKYLATGSGDKTAGLWKFQGSLVTEVTRFKGHKDKVTSVAFSPDGKYLATGGGTVRYWDLRGKLIADSEDYGAKVRSVVFSPDGNYLAIGSDHAVRIWDLKENHPISELKVDPGTVRSVAFSPDGNYLAIASLDGTARLFSTRPHPRRPSGTLVKEFQHQDWVNSVAFSPNGMYLATASNDNTARLWDLFGLYGNLVKEFKGHQFPVFSVAFSSDGKYLATASSDNTARLWNLQQNLVKEFKDRQSERSTPYDIPRLTGVDYPLNYYNSVAISPDGKYLATGSGNQDTTGITARLWDLNGKVVARFKGGKETLYHEGVNVAFSPGGKYLATVSDDKIARLWDLKGKLIRKFEGHQKVITSVAFSPDGKYLATGSDDNTARLWDLKGKLIRKFEGHQKGITSVAFSPDGKYLATGSDDNTARLWDLKGKLIRKFEGHQKGITSVAFSPDGKYLATGSWDRTARLWDLTGKVVKKFKGHQRAVSSLSFSPDGKYVATGSDDNTVRLWDLKGNFIAEFKGQELVKAHTRGIRSVAFSPDGKYLVATGSLNSSVNLWKVERLPDLLARGCYWLSDYLTSHPDDPQAKEVREICKNYNNKP